MKRLRTLHTPGGRSKELRYSAAVGCFALALLARAALDPLLQGQLPFTPFLASAAAAAWFGGFGPALGNLALGFVATESFFYHRGHAWRTPISSDFVVAGTYLLAGWFVVLIGGAIQESRERASAREIALQRQILVRIQAEEALRESHDQMEALVQERTAELNRALAAREHDVVELRRAQGRLSEQAALLQLAHDAILVTDLEGKILFWNGGAETLYGWRSQEALDKTVHHLLRTTFPIPPDEIEAVLYSRGQWEGELAHITSSGQAVTVASRWSLQRDHEGKPSTVLKINRDITERTRAERVLAGKTAELERSNAELQQFAYVASHDLQEPLRMVANFTQLLADRYGNKLDQDAKDFIGYAVEGPTRMRTLIEDLLALSRVGTHGRHFAPVRFGEAASDAVANLELAIRESGALVSLDELPVATADSSQMVQLLQNLIGNGIKFRNKVPPLVHISAARTGNEWTFSVRDNGIGFDPQYAERIFAVFQRLHTRNEYPGTGIGLAICRKIVQRHHGRIWAESNQGSGSTFYFTIPAVSSSVESPGEPVGAL